MYQHNDFGIRIWFFGKGKCYRDWKINSWKIAEPCSAYIRIYFVFNGHAIFEDGDQQITLEKDHLYLIPCNKPHTLTRFPDDPLDHLWIHVSTLPAMVADSVSVISLSNNESLNHLGNAVISHAKSILNMFTPEEYRKKEQPDGFQDCQIPYDIPESYSSKEKIEMFFHSIDTLASLTKSLILMMMSESGNTAHFVHDEYITNAIDIMNKKYSEDINIEIIAKAIGLESKYFIRLFKQKMGVTPYQYLIRIRLSMADILLEKDIPIYKVAQGVGIDPKTFSRVYKMHRKYLPSEYFKKDDCH